MILPLSALRRQRYSSRKPDKPERQRISRPDGARGPRGAMGVVIQTMVEAEIAGVMFTRDPAPVPLNA
jgi:hypothetical protein